MLKVFLVVQLLVQTAMYLVQAGDVVLPVSNAILHERVSVSLLTAIQAVKSLKL